MTIVMKSCTPSIISELNINKVPFNSMCIYEDLYDVVIECDTFYLLGPHNNKITLSVKIDKEMFHLYVNPCDFHRIIIM